MCAFAGVRERIRISLQRGCEKARAGKSKYDYPDSSKPAGSICVHLLESVRGLAFRCRGVAKRPELGSQNMIPRPPPNLRVECNKDTEVPNEPDTRLSMLGPNVFVYNLTGVGFDDIVLRRQSFLLQLSFHKNHIANPEYIKKEMDMSYGLKKSAAHPTTMHYHPGLGGPAEPRAVFQNRSATLASGTNRAKGRRSKTGQV